MIILRNNIVYYRILLNVYLNKICNDKYFKLGKNVGLDGQLKSRNYSNLYRPIIKKKKNKN